MFRVLKRVSPLCLSGVPFFMSKDPDKVSEKELKSLVVSSAVEITPMDRLRAMYYIDEFGTLSEPLNSVVQSTLMSAVIGFVYGGIVKSRNTYINFMENNEASLFTSLQDAKRKLQHRMVISFTKGGVQVSWKLAVFTGIFMLLTKSISEYRGKFSALEYCVGGAVAGGFYKANLGLRASIAGGTLGGLLGGFAGGLTMLLVDVTGITLNDVHVWQHKLHTQRKQQFLKNQETINTESSHPLIAMHDLKVRSMPKSDEV